MLMRRHIQHGLDESTSKGRFPTSLCVQKKLQANTQMSHLVRALERSLPGPSQQTDRLIEMRETDITRQDLR